MPPISSGSSPLARGLLGGLTVVALLARIIPARAGFTGGPGRPRSCPRDHPRSRGVYYFEMNIADRRVGSSPLARGLPWRQVRDPVREGSSPLARGLPLGGTHMRLTNGIIPARAGFTAQRTAGSPTMTDHPRSRGVYEEERNTAMSTIGSSPLARGLPLPLCERVRRRRIIPARAGFTVGGHHPLVGDGDHPRSRGVYPSPPSTCTGRGGSSPLARGLL